MQKECDNGFNFRFFCYLDFFFIFECIFECPKIKSYRILHVIIVLFCVLFII